jgi:hypothetical protein
MTALSPPLATLEEHEAEAQHAVAEAIVAEIESDLREEPLGAGYDEGPVLEHEP